jgi:hypothetical protein
MSSQSPMKPDLEEEDRVKISDLPDIPVLRIASFLEAKDLLNFSHTCRRIFHICDGDLNVWRNVYNTDFPLYKEISGAASTLMPNEESLVSNGEKLCYILHSSTQKNWKTGKAERRAESLPRTYRIQHRFGVGTLETIGSGKTRHFKYDHWDVKSGTSKSFNFNAPDAISSMQCMYSIKISASLYLDHVLILEVSQWSWTSNRLIALELDEKKLEVGSFCYNYKEKTFFYEVKNYNPYTLGSR